MRLTIIKKIFKFLPHLEGFCETNFLFLLFDAIPSTQYKNDTFRLDSTHLEKDFVNHRKPYGKLK